MPFMERRRMNQWTPRFLMLTLPIGVFLMVACGKSNYLKVGENATVTAKEGLYIRAAASAQSKKISLVPYGQEFKVLAEGVPESLYSIKSRWYKVTYRAKTGWLWGGLAHTQDGNSASSNKQATRKMSICMDSSGDCFNDLNACGRTEFYSDGTFHEPMEGCGETGRIEGTWIKTGNAIEVSYTELPQCYDQCDDYTGAYTEKYKRSGIRVYRLLPNNRATYEDTLNGRKESHRQPLIVRYR